MEESEFMAWSIYTGPSNLHTVINDDNCPWVVGQWTGINKNTSKEEIKQDLDARIAYILRSFQKIIPLYKTYNRHFVLPEFFFHCKEGPYPNIKIDEQFYPLEYVVHKMKEELKSIIPNDNNYYTVIIGSMLTSNISDYSTFISSDSVVQRLEKLNDIVSSSLKLSSNKVHTSWLRNSSFLKKENSSDDLTAINDFMEECRANPLATVRNRGIYFIYNKTLMKEVDYYVYEKQCESTVDLTMGIIEQNKISTGGMITEWMANYPSYSIIKGDKQINKLSTNSRFTPEFLGNCDIGVEICLDHRFQRLRRTVDMTKVCGADTDNFPIIRQFIPSGGMQILDYSVAANCSSVIFNADGCDKVYTEYGNESTVILNGEAGAYKGITCGVYTKSIQSKWVDKLGNTCYSHSQLSFTTHNSEIGGFNNALGLNNVKASTYKAEEGNIQNALTDSYKPIVIDLNEDSDLFAATMGEIHYYQPK
ncbi:MAG: hypothetical protein WC149_12330 [Arcobacteraceae bacterium]